MILQGSPQTGFLIKIKANVTKERKRLLLKASWLRKEANVYLRNGPGREADQAPGTRLSEQSPAWPPPLPLSRQRVSAGKCQGVCSEPGSLEIQLQVKPPGLTLKKLRGPHVLSVLHGLLLSGFQMLTGQSGRPRFKEEEVIFTTPYLGSPSKEDLF